MDCERKSEKRQRTKERNKETEIEILDREPDKGTKRKREESNR